MRIFFILFVLLSSIAHSQTLKVTISGVRNNAGTIRVGFYTNSESFDEEKALFTKTESKATLTNGSLTITYNGLKPGTYGIAILDDENSNQKMDYGIILPKEGFGFSDYYHTAMSRPKFDKFKFVLLKDEIKTVNIKVRYL